MEQITALVTQYGPLAVLAGTFFEGETIVLVAGFLAHQAVLNPVTVGLCAFAGAVLGDQLWFYLGRRHAGHALVRRLPRQAVFEKALGAIERHPRKFILSYRFIYGLRTVSPVALGLSDVPAGLFLILNVAAAAVWAAAFTALGYFCGQAVETLWGDIQAAEHRLFVALLVAGAGFVVFQAIRRRRRNSGV